ncbi:MAG: hypothetical protein JRJ59_10145 [Deltaproteobacteria bacterium]|nr:hypothetical protein [Deltaproteobacteria bacterium]
MAQDTPISQLSAGRFGFAVNGTESRLSLGPGLGQIDLAKWGRRDRLKISLPDLDRPGRNDPSLADQKIGQLIEQSDKGPRTLHEFYLKDPPGGDAAHDLEHEITWEANPDQSGLSSGYFEVAYKLSFSKNLRFFKQDPARVRSKGTMPEHIQGGYAIYRTAPLPLGDRKVLMGSIKFGQIPRGQLYAADGRWVWVEPVVKNGGLNYQLPREFLSQAAAPFRFLPTYGYTTVGSSWWDYDGDLGACRPAAALSQAGTLTKVKAYFGGGGVDDYEVRLGVYTHNGDTDRPDSLLDQGASALTIPGDAEDWYELAMPGGETLASGSYYWPAVSVEDADGGMAVAFDTAVSGYKHSGYYGYNWQSTPSFPATFPAPHYENADQALSICLEYTTGWTGEIEGIDDADIDQVEGLALSEIDEIDGV